MDANTSHQANEQYSLAKILLIWLAVSAPMGILAWIVFPAFRSQVNMHPGLFLWILMIAGLLWEVILSFVILYRESGTLNLAAIRQRTWRQQPRDPRTDEPRRKLWWWLVPLILLTAAVEFAVNPVLTRSWTSLFPFFVEPPGYSLEALMDTPAKWVGAWYLLGLWLLQFIGNYLWGEELLWRSVLLPRMQGVFGKWDWMANAFLFGTAHWGKPWHIPSGIISGILYAYPSRRLLSAWFGFILHAADGFFFLFIMLGLILGLV